MGAMSDPSHSPATEDKHPRRRSVFVDISPLRASPLFARLWLGNAIAGTGSQITIVAVGLQVYDITHSTLAVSFVALVALVPMVVVGIYGGMLADVFDRRLIATIAAVVAWCSTAGICAMAWAQFDVVWLLYILTMINTVAATVLQSTRSAILPKLIGIELLPAASALNGLVFGIEVTVGPAIAGVLVAAFGFGPTYSIDVITFSAAFLGILSLPRMLPEGDAGRPGLESLKEGLRFLRSAPNIRMSFIVDIFAMTFGQPRVLFPAVGAVLLGGGAVTVGVLTAAYAVGGILSSLFSGSLGHVRLQGRAVGRAVGVYGVAIAAFGAVLAVWGLGHVGEPAPSWTHVDATGLLLASLALVVAGGSDNVSAIFRSTILNAAAPDAMRGRIQSVFTVVVTGGPRIGDLYVGILSTFTALWFPPLLGGVLITVIVVTLVRLQPTFRHYDALNPVP